MSASNKNAEPAPLAHSYRDNRRHHLRRSICAGAFRATQAARDQRVDPARQVLQEPLRVPGMIRGTARAKSPAQRSGERLIALYLDMLAAERGAGANTLAAYGRDLADFSAYLSAARRSVASAATEDLRAYLGDLARRGMT